MKKKPLFELATLRITCLLGLVLCFGSVDQSLAATYYVDNTVPQCPSGVGSGGCCNDAFSTAQNNATHPWCTLGKANTTHSAGDTVLLKGKFREVLVPKAGISNTQRTVYSGISNNPADAVIVGSEVINPNSWTRCTSGAGCPAGLNTNVYRASFVAGNQCRYSGGGTITVRNTNCWVDKTTWLRRGAQNNAGDALSDLNLAGEYFYDQNSNYLYVWMPNSDSPASHLLECSVRPGLYAGQYTSVPEVHNFTIQNLTITQTNGKGLAITPNPGRPGNVTVQNLEISYTTGDGYCAGNPAGIYWGNSDNYSPDTPNIKILNNSIHDNGSDKGGVDDTAIGNVHAGAGIETYTIKDSLIEGNVIYNTFGPIGIKRGNQNVTIKNNIISASGEGIWIGPPNLNGVTDNIVTATLEGNLIYNTQKSTGHQAGFYTNLGNTTVKMYNNTLFNTSGIRIGTDNNSDSSYRKDNVHIDLKNNIIYELWSYYEMNDLRYMSFRWNSIATSSSDYNLFGSPTHPAANFAGTWVGGTYASYISSILYPTLNNWQTLTLKDQNSLMANPLFVNQASYNFTLQSTSPAIDEGIFIPGFHCAQSDNNGGSALQNCRHWSGSAPDIGAFEFGSSFVDTLPPAPPGGLQIQ